jgi:protein ImuA
LQDVSAGGPGWGGGQAAALGFVLASLPPDEARPLLWVQDRAARRALGRPYETGIRQAYGISAPILRVEVGPPSDALRVMEEGARCAALGAVLGELDGTARALDLVATKRLAMRARDSGVPVWLLRVGGAGEGASAARLRWRVSARPSAPHPWDDAAPGAARWWVELLRATGRSPGAWEVEHEPGARPGGAPGGADPGAGPDEGGAPDRLHLDAELRDGSLAPAAGAGGDRRAAG